MAFNRVAVAASAEKLVARGKIDGAIKEYRKLVADNPNDAMTLNRLGDLYVRTGKNEEAVKLFTQIAERYTEDGFFVKAIAIFKKIIKLDPTRLPVYERLAELYHKQGLVSEARTQYQVLVDYYMKHGKAESAESVLEKMTALDPGDPTPHVKLAEIYHARGDRDRELAEYRALAELMIRHQRIDEATQVYARAIHAAPDDLGFVTDAVLGLKDAGHNAAAVKLLAIAVEKNPHAEKIARIAGLGGRDRVESSATGVRRPEEDTGRILKVSDVASAPPELRVASPAAKDTAPAKQRPELHPEDLRSAEETADELERTFSGGGTVETAETAEAASAGPGGGTAGDVLEFDLELEIDGVELDSAPAPAPQEAPAPSAGAVESIDWQFTPEPDLDLAPPPPRAVEPEPPAPAGEPAGADVLFIEPIEEALPDVVAPVSTDTPVEAPVEELADRRPAGEAPAELDLGATAAVEGPESRRAADLEVTEVRPAPVAAAQERVRADRRLADLLAEAEVFRKYGLAEKAGDRVREILREEPGHPGALELGVYLALDAGRLERALPRAQELERVASQQPGAAEIWSAVRTRLEKAGFVFEHGRPTAAPAAKRRSKDSVSALLDELTGLTSPSRPSRPSAAKKGSAISPSADLAALVDGLVEPTPSRRASAPRAAPPEIPAVLELESLLREAAPAPAAPRMSPPAAEAPTAPPPAAEAPPVEAAKPEPEVEAAPAVDEMDKAIESRLAWLDEAAERAASPPASAAAPTQSVDELFDEEEGFFDLAAELEEELTQEEIVSGEELLPREEPSLEEIVEGFKKGVAESLSAEDYDTHFNLGIAYREMGLLDEAIGEFQLAAKHENYLLDCCSLLGGCFLEKGLPELAIKWYRRGLETPGLSEDGNLGLLYDLGNLYLAIGDDDNARRAFIELYGINSNYRDIVPLLEHLGAS